MTLIVNFFVMTLIMRLITLVARLLLAFSPSVIHPRPHSLWGEDVKGDDLFGAKRYAICVYALYDSSIFCQPPSTLIVSFFFVMTLIMRLITLVALL